MRNLHNLPILSGYSSDHVNASFTYLKPNPPAVTAQRAGPMILNGKTSVYATPLAFENILSLTVRANPILWK